MASDELDFFNPYKNKTKETKRNFLKKTCMKPKGFTPERKKLFQHNMQAG